MARLADPHVVTVHEARERHRIRDGARRCTGAARLIRSRNGWREIVAVFLAGRGWSPRTPRAWCTATSSSNVFVDRHGNEGRRFRLVGAYAGDTSAPPALSADLTQTGSVVARPRTWHRSNNAVAKPTPRADQYSFCVSLAEGIGERAPRAVQAIVARGRSLSSRIDTIDGRAGHRARARAPPAARSRLPRRRSRSRGAPSPSPRRSTRARRRIRARPQEIASPASDDRSGRRPCPTSFPSRCRALPRSPGPRRFRARLTTMSISACRANRVTRSESDTLYDRRDASSTAVLSSPRPRRRSSRRRIWRASIVRSPQHTS